MRKFFVVWLLCIVQSVFAQLHEPVSFSVKQNILSDRKMEIVFTGRIDAGWHVYGVDIPKGGPVPTTVTFEDTTGVSTIGSLEARGKVVRAQDPIFNMVISYMEGEAVFVQKLQIKDADYRVSGYLTYGACNEENCTPPTNVEFSFTGSGALASGTAGQTPAEESEKEAVAENTSDTKAPKTVSASSDEAEWWTPVINELQALGSESTTDSSRSLFGVFAMGLLGGLLALLTPCVWPIIPMTVSFFLKRSQDRRRGIRDAIIYGISIVVIYVSLGLLVTVAFGASALNALSTNAVFNILFFLMLLTFGASFLGGFEIALPSSWTNAVDRKSESATGLLSIFLMAFTLSLVSFSCTGPIIGFLLVEVSTGGGASMAPIVGMSGFALALALPFSIFALFPAWLKSAPKSGNWMNVIKVCLGVLELAFALKFLSVADLAYGWHILDREVFLSLWIVLFALLGTYLAGWIRLPHDEDEYDEEGNVVVRPRIGVTRFFAALASFAFALYMIPGLWGAPCKAVSAFAPPMSTQDFNLMGKESQTHFTDYVTGMRYARDHKMPVLLDFTGYGCVNCREMEAAVWSESRVADIVADNYVLITLYVDEKESLAEPIEITENGTTRRLRTVGDKWSYLQRSKFGANAQPFYVPVDNNGKPLAAPYSYDTDVEHCLNFLNEGLKQYEKNNIKE